MRCQVIFVNFNVYIIVNVAEALQIKIYCLKALTCSMVLGKQRWKGALLSN